MNKLTIILITIIFLSFISAQTVFAIGQITAPITINDVLRGQEVSTELTLLNSENKELTYGLRAGGQVADWAAFFSADDTNFENPITEIKMPPDQYTNVNVRFKIPDDTPNGEYTGELLVFLASSGELKSEETSVSVSQQIGRDVTISVTDKEIIKLQANFIPLTYDVQQGKPLKIRVLYDNQGNIAVKPDLQLKITKNGETVYNAIFTYSETEEAVRAYTNREISPIEWQTTGQENGNYTAELKVILNGQEIQSSLFKFLIGHFQNSMWISAVSFLGGGNLTVGWFVIAGILLILAIIFDVLRKKGVNLSKVQLVFNNIRRLF